MNPTGRAKVFMWGKRVTRLGGSPFHSDKLLVSHLNVSTSFVRNKGKVGSPTYPSPMSAFCPKWEVSVNVGLGEGKVGSFPET